MNIYNFWKMCAIYDFLMIFVSRFGFEGNG